MYHDAAHHDVRHSIHNAHAAAVAFSPCTQFPHCVTRMCFPASVIETPYGTTAKSMVPLYHMLAAGQSSVMPEMNESIKLSTTPYGYLTPEEQTTELSSDGHPPTDLTFQQVQKVIIAQHVQHLKPALTHPDAHALQLQANVICKTLASSLVWVVAGLERLPLWSACMFRRNSVACDDGW